MKRKDLKAGMLLYHQRTRNIAQVAYEKDGRTLLPAHRDYVQVESVNFGPWRRGKLRRTTWVLARVRERAHAGGAEALRCWPRSFACPDAARQVSDRYGAGGRESTARPTLLYSKTNLKIDLVRGYILSGEIVMTGKWRLFYSKRVWTGSKHLLHLVLACTMGAFVSKEAEWQLLWMVATFSIIAIGRYFWPIIRDNFDRPAL